MLFTCFQICNQNLLILLKNKRCLIRLKFENYVTLVIFTINFIVNSANIKFINLLYLFLLLLLLPLQLGLTNNVQVTVINCDKFIILVYENPKPPKILDIILHAFTSYAFETLLYLFSTPEDHTSVVKLETWQWCHLLWHCPLWF